MMMMSKQRTSGYLAHWQWLHRLLGVLQDYLQLLQMSDAVYSQKSIPWYGCIPIVHPCQCQNVAPLLFSWMDDLCHAWPFAFTRVLSIAVMERPTNSSMTNRYPIVDILPFTSVEMVFNRLSNVRLPGIVARPQASASLRLYWQSMPRKVCNALLESILNHILTTKHLRITVGEYTQGLPRFRGAIGHGMQPIRHRMLKSMDSFILPRANLWDSYDQNHIPGVSFKLL